MHDGWCSEDYFERYLKEVPPRKAFGEESTPLQKLGHKLALFVFFYIVGASILIFIVRSAASNSRRFRRRQ